MNSYMHVLTEKGLRYIVDNVTDNVDAVLAAKAELTRRKLPIKPLRHYHTKDMRYLPRDKDGYERDH